MLMRRVKLLPLPEPSTFSSYRFLALVSRLYKSSNYLDFQLAICVIQHPFFLLNYLPDYEIYFISMSQKFLLFSSILQSESHQQQNELFKLPFAALTLFDYSLEMPSLLDDFLFFLEIYLISNFSINCSPFNNLSSC
jgi:hypothetical protein